MQVICPVCKGIASYDLYFQSYICLNKECQWMESKDEHDRKCEHKFEEIKGTYQRWKRPAAGYAVIRKVCVRCMKTQTEIEMEERWDGIYPLLCDLVMYREDAEKSTDRLQRVINMLIEELKN